MLCHCSHQSNVALAHKRDAIISAALRFLAVTSVALIIIAFQAERAGTVQAQSGNFTVYGRVSAPDGRPAARVTVKIDGLTGLNRQTQSDDQGAYEFRSIPGGRYHLTITNPNDPTQVMDAVEADTARSSANRLLVHLYLHTATAYAPKETRPGVLSVIEAGQNVPKNARKAYDQGLKSKADNKFDQALKSFDNAVQIFPEYFQALSEQGEIYIKLGRISAADDVFERALKIDDSYRPALRGLGLCKLQEQKFGEAARYLMRALESDYDDADSHLFLGIALLNLKQPALAEQALHESLRLDNVRAASAHVYLADLYSRQERYGAAADELHVYLAARPAAPNAAKLKEKEAQLRAKVVKK